MSVGILKEEEGERGQCPKLLSWRQRVTVPLTEACCYRLNYVLPTLPEFIC